MKFKNSKFFASDNSSGIHPAILEAIAEANTGHTIAYGYDEYTQTAERNFNELFGREVDVFFVYGGTAANVLSLNSLTRPFNAVICTSIAHINVDECGAPEKFTGCKLLAANPPDAKLTPSLLEQFLPGRGVEHHVQPAVVSITQATEYGTIYSPDEVRNISEFSRKHNFYLHMDGARIANAVASLNCPISEITCNAGVDVLSFGGTKNGLMMGEAVVFFRKDLADHFRYYRKQAMQLSSKMRFVSAQFNRYLTDGLWLDNASHANRMAKLLSSELAKIEGVTITQKTEANGVFAILPAAIISALQEEYYFYVWNEQLSEVRLMCSFDTEEKDVKNFVALVKQKLEIIV